MSLISKNPYTEEILAEFSELSEDEVLRKIDKAAVEYKKWSTMDLEDRITMIERLIPELEARRDSIAKTMALEMGKPISQGVGEIDKCIMLINHYSQNASKYLKPKKVETEAQETYIRFDPLGVILGVMPWNFPFWQAIRFAVPIITAGNVIVLKHASNVPQSSKILEEIFIAAGLPEGVFQNLHIGASKVEMVIRHKAIQGVALTGSEKAGQSVASIAGSELKKCVLELGGSDAFIVLEDADIDAAVKAGVASRTRNNGQACNAAKRFLVEECIFDEFIEKFKNSFASLKTGDPLDGNTDIGPLVNEQSLNDITDLVSKSVDMGAELLCGGNRVGTKGYLYEPTVVVLNKTSEEINEDMPLYKEESFGAVATVIKVRNKDHAIQVANDTKFGLGTSIWTKDLDKAKEMIPQIESGSVYVNSMVSSDPRTPFGGIKSSGYGREMGEEGIKEFTNVKTVLIK